MSSKKILVSIDGIMGAGKTFLFDHLQQNNQFKDVVFIMEPSHQFREYKNHTPLKDYYANPHSNCAFSQLFILDILQKLYSETFCQCNSTRYISERNLYSAKIFTTAQYKMGYINEFQHDYIIDKIQEKIKTVLPNDCNLGCNRLVYLATDLKTCFERDKSRLEEGNMRNLHAYLECLQNEYEEYFKEFIQQHGSTKTIRVEDFNSPDSIIPQIQSLMHH